MQKRKEILLKKGKEKISEGGKGMSIIDRPSHSTRNQGLSINDKPKHNTQTAKIRESSKRLDDVSRD